MARISRAQRLADKHAYFAQDFNTIWVACQAERRQALQDRRFYSITGAQYEDELGQQFSETPRFEYNKVHQAVIRVFSEYRNNRITVKFRPADKGSSSETAETLTGGYRADEQQSTAQEAYDNGFEEAAGGGMGAWRYIVVPIDEDDEDATDGVEVDGRKVRISIEPIYDADTSVFFDLDAKRQDKADAKRCYVITSMSRAGYIKANPKADVSSWQIPKISTFFDWCTPDVIYIAEVYEIERKGVTLHIFQSSLTEDEKELDDDDMQDAAILADLEATGYTHARDEKTTRRYVHKYIMNGCQIMEDCGYIPGRCIPVVPVYGKRWFVDNIERFMGQVRLAKDLQRLLNMMISRLAELNSLTPYEVPILTPQQVAGHTTSWAEGNIKRQPYRLINPVKDAAGNMVMQPMSYLKPPDVPPALAALVAVASGGIDELTGGQAAQEKDINSGISGRAVELITKRIDMQSFIYTDNMAKAMTRGGQIWLSIKKDITPDEPHDATIVKPDGSQDFVTMMAPAMDEDGNITKTNNPNGGRFNVWADVGPSFTSRRDATIRAIMELLQTIANADPQLAAVLASTAIMNMDGEGLEELRDFMRKKLIGMGAVKPTDEEAKQAAQEQAAQPPDPNATFLNASAAKENALADKARADTVASLTKAENTAADTTLKEQQAHATHVDTTLAVHAATQVMAQPEARQ